MRQIRRIVTQFLAPAWLTKMPPADLKNVAEPQVRNLAKIGTTYGNGTDETREMIDATLNRQAWSDWAKGVK